MSQTLAILVDAYRELNARKLFWITLGISAIVIAVYASIGFDAKGIFFFFGLWHVESEFLRADSDFARLLYRSIFSSFIVSIWLAWIATVLALISTASIFPDMISSGSIDLVLSKPIGRVRLFVTKYVVSLLFVVLQVALFCLGAFVCMGWRIGEWNFKIFLAVPLVTLFFSYLFSVSVLAGVMTRSTLAALLLTLVFWFSLFGGSLAYGILVEQRVRTDLHLENSQRSLESHATQLAQISEAAEPDGLAGERVQLQIDSQMESHDKLKSANERLRWWEDFIWKLQSPFPKTDETINLLGYWLKKKTDISMADLMTGNFEPSEAPRNPWQDRQFQIEVGRRVEKIEQSQSTLFVIATSLGFEAAVLALACFIFVRRDY